ncbi:hypothetical protein PIB30_065920 [Stylosanthes scabra]|uniref:Uncharacterized protein n=1 Tax=Stylosanthes scabra TaxID=79078 RepID=A0ABU6UPL2_9FABA|nr:hypothetical protein [Stylosanthes scabra]
MAGLLKKRKGKAVAQSSSEVSKFKTPYHEAHYKSKLSARKVLPELIISINDEILSKCAVQIKARRVTHSPNAASYHERKANKDYRLEEVQEDLCLEGREWIRHRDGRPHYLRRNDLDPMAKGWYDFVCRSILPTTNRFELTVERAFVYKTDLASSLPFPSIIAALCLEAKVVIKEDTYIPQEPPIVGEVMTRTRETRARNPRQARQEAPPQQQPPQEQPQPKSTINKIFLQTSTLTLTPPCHKFIGGSTNNKRRVGRALRPST